MSHAFERKLARSWPPHRWQNVTVLAAVSGGADSVALLMGLSRIGGVESPRLFAAHFNHGWRGAAADADAAFVVGLCKKLGVPLEAGDASADAAARTEEAARKSRYAFLLERAERIGARYVVTAHTADDQAETVLQRIVRGTGVAGLAGMRRTRPFGGATLLRPLLTFRRAEIEGYLSDGRQPYRQDESNLDLRFTRNRIRHELTPYLAGHFNPGITDALLRLSGQSAEAWELVERAAGDLAQRCTSSSAELVSVRCQGLEEIPPVVVRQMLVHVWRGCGWPERAMTFRHWRRLAKIARLNEAARQTFPGGVDVLRAGEMLTLLRKR